MKTKRKESNLTIYLAIFVWSIVYALAWRSL